jgi:hypothetical protein
LKLWTQKVAQFTTLLYILIHPHIYRYRKKMVCSHFQLAREMN